MPPRIASIWSAGRAPSRPSIDCRRRYGNATLRWNPLGPTRLWRTLHAVAGAAWHRDAAALLFDATTLDAPTLLMSYLPGRSTLQPRDMGRFLSDMASALARIHTVPSEEPVLSTCQTPSRRLAQLFAVAEQHPGLDSVTDGSSIRRVFADVRRRPLVGRLVLLHGDYWAGNVVWRGSHLHAVLDWDQASAAMPPTSPTAAPTLPSCSAAPSPTSFWLPPMKTLPGPRCPPSASGICSPPAAPYRRQSLATRLPGARPQRSQRVGPRRPRTPSLRRPAPRHRLLSSVDRPRLLSALALATRLRACDRLRLPWALLTTSERFTGSETGDSCVVAGWEGKSDAVLVDNDHRVGWHIVHAPWRADLRPKTSPITARDLERHARFSFEQRYQRIQLQP